MSDHYPAIVCSAVSFIYVFLKAWQQLNVVEGRYAWVMPTSIGMGLCEVAIVLLVVKANTVLLGAANGVGAGLGAILAMRLHGIFRRQP
jgi:hypothetical protein